MARILSQQAKAIAIIHNSPPGELQRRRRRLGLSLRELSSELGVSHTLLWKWERGVVEPRAAHALAWLLALQQLESIHLTGAV